MRNLSTISQELLDLALTPSQLDSFRVYADELMIWNQRTNLTAIVEREAVAVRHFVDSLSCLLALRLPLAGARVIDVGTGAGFPGLPLKIVCPGMDLTLVEATGKKVDFLHHVVEVLGIEGVTVINERAETLGRMAEHREAYDWALARAVAGMSTLAEYLLPLCRVGGACLAQKGEAAHQEVAEAHHAIHVLGGRLRGFTQVELPTVAETRYLVTIDKVAATPPRYPRRPGIPTKRPL
jgi:16S rRNA (guanine527-N7)-methyltransferase